MQRAGLPDANLGHVNANGFSTVDDDIYEATAIHSVFRDVPVIAPKSAWKPGARYRSRGTGSLR